MEDFNSRIGRTVQAYSSNPKGLEKKYQMDKELADLIGLQTILSQQDAISRETMLRENQQEGNIKQQYEQKLTSNNQDGTAKRISELLASRTGQQPPATQGIAGQRPPMPQGQRPPMPQGQRPPMPQGAVSQGIASQPRPNMRMAAQGGIIGYVGGGQVDRVKAFIAQRGGKLTQQEMSDVANASKQDPEVIAFLTQNQGFISASENDAIDKSATALAAPAGAPVVNSGIAAATKQGAALAPTAPAVAPVTPKTVAPAGGFGVPPAVAPATLSAPAGGFGVPPATGTPKTVAPKTVDPTAALINAQAKYSGDPTAVDQFMESIGEMGLGKEDFDLSNIKRGQVPEKTNKQKGLRAIQEANALTSPTQMAEAERKRLDDRYGIANRKTEMTDEIALQKARDKSQMDPEKLKEEERNAILRGMALGGVRGSTLAQERLKANTSRNQQSNMDRIRSMTKNRHAETFNALSKVDDQAATIWKAYSEQADRAMTILSTMDANDIKAVEERYKTDVLAKSSQLGNVVAAAQAANELTLLKMQRETQSRAALNKIMKDARDSSIEIRNSFNENPLYKQAIREAQSTIQQATTDDPPSTQELTEAKNVMRDHQALIEKALDDALISQTIENASAKLIEIG